MNDAKLVKTPYQVDLGGKAISVVQIYPGIIAPVAITDDISKWSGLLSKLSASLIANSLASEEFPWIVSSGTTDMSGSKRGDSKAHLNGIALDVAPTYAKESLVDTDGSNPHLATDLMKLELLNLLDIPCAWVVEGDHLHIMALENPKPGYIFSYPTYQRFYALGANIPTVWGGKLLKKLFIYHPDRTTLCPATAAESNLFTQLFVKSIDELADHSDQ